MPLARPVTAAVPPQPIRKRATVPRSLRANSSSSGPLWTRLSKKAFFFISGLQGHFACIPDGVRMLPRTRGALGGSELAHGGCAWPACAPRRPQGVLLKIAQRRDRIACFWHCLRHSGSESGLRPMCLLGKFIPITRPNHSTSSQFLKIETQGSSITPP